MRHANSDDLARLETVLERLRSLPALVERRPGVFYRGGRAFCHFHADGAGEFVDVRLGEEFERLPVTTATEQRRFAALARRELGALRSPVGGARA